MTTFRVIVETFNNGGEYCGDMEYRKVMRIEPATGDDFAGYIALHIEPSEGIDAHEVLVQPFNRIAAILPEVAPDAVPFDVRMKYCDGSENIARVLACVYTGTGFWLTYPEGDTEFAPVGASSEIVRVERLPEA